MCLCKACRPLPYAAAQPAERGCDGNTNSIQRRKEQQTDPKEHNDGENCFDKKKGELSSLSQNQIHKWPQTSACALKSNQLEERVGKKGVCLMYHTKTTTFSLCMWTEWFNIEPCDVHDMTSTGTVVLTMVTGTQ